MRVTVLAMIALALSACSSGSTSDGDACATAAARCPSLFMGTPTCTPAMACPVQCLLDSECAMDERFSRCVQTECGLGVVDSGTGVDGGVDTYTPPSDEVDSGHVTPPDDTGTSGTDSSGGSGRGCSADDPNSCTCAPGVTDDGKGCSVSRLASSGACCAEDDRCRCQSVTCSSTSSGCTCVVSGLPASSSTTSSCSGSLCCTFPASSSFGFGACACYAGGKPGGCAVLGGTEVSSCTPTNVPCYYKGEHSVSTCK